MAEVRALYFRMRYGRELAMFHAIARPKVFNKAVCKVSRVEWRKSESVLPHH